MDSLIPSSIRTAGERETEECDNGHTEADFLTIPPRWTLWPLDWQDHAIDTWADHPLGVWIVRCGHQLLGGTPLYDLPQGKQCASCAKWSQMSKAG